MRKKSERKGRWKRTRVGGEGGGERVGRGAADRKKGWRGKGDDGL